MEKTDERVYVIKYRLYDACGGGFKYALRPIYQERKEYFDRSERDKFILKYNYLREKEDMYISDIECYFAELHQILNNEMRSLIEKI